MLAANDNNAFATAVLGFLERLHVPSAAGAFNGLEVSAADRLRR